MARLPVVVCDRCQASGSERIAEERGWSLGEQDLCPRCRRWPQLHATLEALADVCSQIPEMQVAEVQRLVENIILMGKKDFAEYVAKR